MAELRIISLLPAATEMVYDLGLKDNLVGVSDDSDFPKDARKLPQVVTTLLPAGLTSKQIDNRFRRSKHTGIGIFHVDKELLQKLSPNLVLSQELCSVCAIATSEIKKAARILKNPVRTVSLEPESVPDVFENINLIGSLTGKEKEAKELIRKLRKRLDTVLLRSKTQKPRSVLIIEWLDPLMVAGHWVPEMVEMAGGTSLVLKPGDISRKITSREILKLDPEIIIISPCGFDITRTKKEIGLLTSKKWFRKLQAVKDRNIYLIDGNAYLTRPGPRIVDGVEILSEILHPDIFTREHSHKGWEKLNV